MLLRQMLVLNGMGQRGVGALGGLDDLIRLGQGKHTVKRWTTRGRSKSGSVTRVGELVSAEYWLLDDVLLFLPDVQ
jgi:hypothetical protein